MATKPRVKVPKASETTWEAELAGLKALVPDSEVIVLRTLSREEAKAEIRVCFATGETLYYSDIAKQLRIELPLVVDLCQELQQEGEIEVGAVIDPDSSPNL